MTNSFARFALLSGNFMVGLSVLAPTGMLPQLSAGLGISIRDAGLLVTYGAVILCLGSPIVSWLTTRLGRRLLMSGALAIMAVGHIASAFADSYLAILSLRLAMLIFAAIYTPQAASTIALIVPEKSRAGAVAFVFLGWSLAIAAGLPLITFFANQFGWRETYAAIGVLSALIALMNVAALPGGLQGHPLSLQSFVTIGRNTTLVLILLITLFQMSGQFSITVYMGPVLGKVADAGPAAAGIFFSLLGIAGLLGNLAATSIVVRAGVSRTLATFMILMTCGAAVWSLGAGILPVMAVGIFCMGLGITAANSMQQARLIAVAPELAGATVAMNSSVLYVGQALGSATAGVLFERQHYHVIGFIAVAFFLMAVATFALSERSDARGAN